MRGSYGIGCLCLSFRWEEWAASSGKKFKVSLCVTAEGWAVVARFPIPWRFQEERVLRCVLAVLMCWAQGEHGPKWLVSVSLREAKADGRLTRCLRWVPKQL